MIELRGDSHLGQEPIRPDYCAQVGAKKLEGYVAVVFQVFREVYGSHAPGPDLAIDGVSVCECFL